MKDRGMKPGLERLNVPVEAHSGETIEVSARVDEERVQTALQKIDDASALRMFDVVISAITKTPCGMQVHMVISMFTPGITHLA
jgi:hypothetical protein